MPLLPSFASSPRLRHKPGRFARFDRFHADLDGCIAWLPCNDIDTQVFDIMFENYGIVRNTDIASAWGEGQYGPVLLFNGQDSRVDMQASERLDNIQLQGNGGLSVTVWIYPFSLGEGAAGRIVQKDDNGSSGRWLLNLASSNRIAFLKNGSTALSVISSNNAIVLNTWNHVAVTWDGSVTATQVHLYVNGFETSYGTQQNGAGLNSDAALRVRLGSRTNGTDTFYGAMDDVRIYNRVLSQDRIRSVMNNPWAPFVRRRVLWVQSVAPDGTTLTPDAVRAVYGASTSIVTTGDLHVPSVRAEYRASTPMLTRSFAAPAIRGDYRANTPAVVTGTLQVPTTRGDYRTDASLLTRSFAAPVVTAEYRASTPVVTTGDIQIPAVRAIYRTDTPQMTRSFPATVVRAEYRASIPVAASGGIALDTPAVRAEYRVSTPTLTRTIGASPTRAEYRASTPTLTTGTLQSTVVRAEYRTSTPVVTTGTLQAQAVRAEYRVDTPTTEGGGGTTLQVPAVRGEYRVSTPMLTRSFAATGVRGDYRVNAPVLSLGVTAQPSRAEYRTSTPVVTRTMQASAVRAEYRVVVPAVTMTIVASPSRAEYRVSTPVVARTLMASPITGQYAVITPLLGRTVLVTATRGQYATRAPSVTGGGQLLIDALATRGEYAVQTPIAALAVPPFTRMAPTVFLRIRQRAEEVTLTYE